MVDKSDRTDWRRSVQRVLTTSRSDRGGAGGGDGGGGRWQSCYLEWSATPSAAAAAVAAAVATAAAAAAPCPINICRYARPA